MDDSHASNSPAVTEAVMSPSQRLDSWLDFTRDWNKTARKFNSHTCINLYSPSARLLFALWAGDVKARPVFVCQPDLCT